MIGAWRSFLLLAACLCLVVHFAESSKRAYYRNYGRNSCRRFPNCKKCSPYKCQQCNHGYYLHRIYNNDDDDDDDFDYYSTKYVRHACVPRTPAVNGGWTRWSRWSVCKGRCGQGEKDRRRSCTNPRPIYGGKNCYGYAKETRKCNTGRRCAVDGGWTDWSRWSVCRGRCGQGEQDRRRSCTNPRPMYRGKNCYGFAKETRKCNTGRHCAVDGGWTDWSRWSVCIGRCGQGEQDRRRSCTNPRPMYRGKNCDGYAKETRKCNTGRQCAVYGGWTDWGPWSVCRGRCGQGEQDRHRSCTNPKPMYGGKECYGKAKESHKCDTGRLCPQAPVDGRWSKWSVWTICGGQCGVGIQNRFRSCNNPEPAHGGRPCQGPIKGTRKCDTGRPCAVDGGWSDWSQWSVCSGRCGVAEQDRRRSCTNPRPINGGKDCSGYGKETRKCDTGRSCAVDGGWTDWSRWSVCRGRCGQGEQDRRRSCTNPKPMYDGKECYGYAKETRKCDTGRPCLVDGGWTDWSRWSVCRGRCGQGEQDRRRSCTNPKPMYKGKDCHGYAKETRKCDTGRLCPQAPVNPCHAMFCKGGRVCKVIKGRGRCVRLCPQKCSKTYDPVCGTDRRTYGNECMLKAISCKYNSYLKVSYAGECWQQYGKHYG